MSRCQNVTLSDELAKRKTKIADMEWELAAECERVRKEEEEEERTCEAAEAWQWAATHHGIRHWGLGPLQALEQVNSQSLVLSYNPKCHRGSRAQDQQISKNDFFLHFQWLEPTTSSTREKYICIANIYITISLSSLLMYRSNTLTLWGSPHWESSLNISHQTTYECTLPFKYHKHIN